MRPVLVSLTVTAAFACLGCVDLTEPWLGAGSPDASDTGDQVIGGVGGQGATPAGGVGGTTDALPGGLDSGQPGGEGGVGAAGAGGAGVAAGGGAGGAGDVGLGGADGGTTVGKAQDAGAGGAGGAMLDAELEVPTGGTGGVATDGADGSESDGYIEGPADVPLDVPTGGTGGSGTGGTETGGTGAGGAETGGTGAGGSGTGGSGTGGTGTGGSGTGGSGTGGTGAGGSGTGGTGAGGTGTGGAGTGGAGTGGAGTGGAGTGGIGGSTDAGSGTDGGLSVGLVAYYPCEQASGTTLPDSSGHSYDGTLASGTGGVDGGAPYSFGSGEVGNALILNAASKGYLSAPAGILATAHEMTIAVWVYANSNPSWQRIFDFGKDQNVDMVLVSNNNNTSRPRFAISLTGPGAAQTMDAPSALPLTWTHLAVVLGSSGGFLYVNGQQVATNSSMTLRPVDLGSTPNNYFGRSQYASDPYLDGSLDEIRIYDRALAPEEVLALANGQQ